MLIALITNFPKVCDNLFHFNRALFNFLWKSKSDPLNRNTVYLPFDKGGLNICNIGVKLQAFHRKHIQFVDNDYPAKWTHFAKYWIGLALRKYNKKLASLLCPHNEYIPPFYQKCLNALKLFESKRNNSLIGNLSIKSFYQALTPNAVFPPIVSKFPLIPFDRVWKFYNSKFIDPFARDISWKISHNILPVQHVLYSRNIRNILRCHFCVSDIETCMHIFYNCCIVKLNC